MTISVPGHRDVVDRPERVTGRRRQPADTSLVISSKRIGGSSTAGSSPLLLHQVQPLEALLCEPPAPPAIRP